jgi:hypothetical protein
MFTLGEVISITLVVSVIVGYLAYQLAEFNMIARILNGMSDSELARLERLKDKLEAAVDDIERDQILANESRPSGTVMLTQEVVNGHVYLYDLSGNFVCQGATWEEVASRFGEIDKREALVKCDNDRKYSIVAGKIKN